MLANKRMLALGTGVVAVAMTVTACSSGAVQSGGGSTGGAGGAVTLKVATVNNGQMKDMEKLKSEYEAANPGVTVNFQVMEEGDLRAAVTADVASGAGQYDIVTIGACVPSRSAPRPSHRPASTPFRRGRRAFRRPGPVRG